MGDSFKTPLPDLQNFVGRTGPGLYTHEIYRRLAALPIFSTRDSLANRLLREQEAGALRFRARRWRSPDQGDQLAEYPNESAGVYSGRRYLDAIPADVLPGHPQPIAEQQSDTSDAPPEGWNLLRHLLPHYRECLRLGGASGLSQHIDRHRQQFEVLRPRGRWWPDAAGARILRIERRHLTPAFLQGLHQRQTDPVLLGYPLSVATAGEEHLFIDPVSILQCAWQIDDAALTLWPIETVPKLNPDWIKRRKERRAIRELSLWLKGIDDEAPLVRPEGDGWADLPDLVKTLRSVSSAPTLGPLDPAQTSARLDLGADGAIQNVAGLFLVGQSLYSRGARRDLNALTEWSDEEYAGTALAGIFSPENAIGLPPVPVISPLPISEAQYLAVRDGLREPLTVISGPPGTGKSQVVVALMVSAAAAGRSVLFASHRHQAIDAVQNRLEALVGELPFLARAYAGGQGDSFSFDQAVSLILGRNFGTEAVRRFEEKMAGSTGVVEKLDSLLDRVAAFEALGERLAQLNAELSRREVDAVPSAESPDGIGTFLYRWFRTLLRLLRFHSDKDQEAVTSEVSYAGLSTSDLKRLCAEIEGKHRSERRAIEAAMQSARLPDLLNRLCEEGKKLLPALVDATHACSEEDAARLVDLKGNLGLTQSAEGLRQIWSQNASVVLRHFPLWACSTLAVSGRIPLAPGLFDYLVIDEATTSDIASALPLIARARQVIIVGDRQQTGMISDLHPMREAEMRSQAGLGHSTLGRFTYSKVSLFDLAWACSTARRHMLRDHFRCHSEIAAYCSETFYEGRLFVRTDAASLRPPRGQKAGLHWTDVKGPIERAGNGCRSHSEASALVEHLSSLIGDGAYDGTVGVVTPFNRQAELLTHMIEQRLPHDVIEKVQLRVGTSHAFQGDDRDIVLVSLCYGRGMPRNGDWFLRNSRELMNVAVSRARAVCHVFGDREAAQRSDIRHIARLARNVGAEGAPDGDPQALFDSPWEERLYDALRRGGIEAIPQYRLGGRRLDLAVIENGIRLDVEVDGDTYHRDPDGFRKVSDIWRDHVITSLGWQVRRFWVYELKEDMEKCVELVRRDIGR